MSSSDTFCEEFEFTWRIENFSMYPQQPGQAILSPLLSVGNPCHSIFYLKLYPKGWDETLKHIVAADLVRLEGSLKNHLVCQISIVACDNSLLEGQISTSIIEDESIGAMDFYRRILIQEDSIENFLPNDTLSVRCKLEIQRVSQHLEVELNTLSEIINSVYESKAYIDLTLCTTDEEFLVHKFFLCQRANTFFIDLGIPINNKVHARIDLNGISTRVFKPLIQYLYNGKFEVLPPAVVPEIFEIAEAFGIKLENFIEFTNKVFTLGPPFTISTYIKVLSKEVSWHILDEATMMGDTDDLDKSICFGPIQFLVKLHFSVTDANISFKCLSKLEKKILLGCKMYVGIKDAENWASVKYQKLQFLVDDEGSEQHLPSQHLQRYYSKESGLRLQLLVSVSDCDKISSADSLITTEKPSQFGLNSLRNNMIDMFNRTQINDGSDVTLVLLNALGVIRAHKAILSAWSPVFKSMFNNEVAGEGINKVDILEVDSLTALRLITYLYSGSVIKKSFEEDTKLYMLADMYKVSSLFTRCSTYLESHLVLSNVCDILKLAYMHSDELLLALTKKFIFSNREAVESSREWKLLSDAYPHFSSMMQEPV